MGRSVNTVGLFTYNPPPPPPARALCPVGRKTCEVPRQSHWTSSKKLLRKLVLESTKTVCWNVGCFSCLRCPAITPSIQELRPPIHQPILPFDYPFIIPSIYPSCILSLTLYRFVPFRNSCSPPIKWNTMPVCALSYESLYEEHNSCVLALQVRCVSVIVRVCFTILLRIRQPSMVRWYARFVIGCFDDVREMCAVWLVEKEGVCDGVLVARSGLKCLSEICDV
jgi:hypothetical protein